MTMRASNVSSRTHTNTYDALSSTHVVPVRARALLRAATRCKDVFSSIRVQKLRWHENSLLLPRSFARVYRGFIRVYLSRVDRLMSMTSERDIYFKLHVISLCSTLCYSASSTNGFQWSRWIPRGPNSVSFLRAARGNVLCSFL